MERYEITFITRSEEDDGGMAALIAQFGGQIESQTPPVRRKLAYPIRKETAGVYYTYLFDMEPTRIGEMNQKLRRNEAVLRHLVIAGGIRKPIEVPRKLKDSDLEVPESLTKGMAELAAEEAKEKEAAAITTTEPAQPVIDEVVETAEVVTEPAEEPVKKSAKKEISAEESTAEDRQKQLDEKLKQILGE